MLTREIGEEKKVVFGRGREDDASLSCQCRSVCFLFSLSPYGFVHFASSLLKSNTSLRPTTPFLCCSQLMSVFLSQDASAELGVDLDREIPIVYQKDSSFADSLWSILPMALVLGAWIFITRRTRKCYRRLVLQRLLQHERSPDPCIVHHKQTGSGGLPPTGGGGGRGGGQNPMGFIKKDFKPVQLAVKTTYDYSARGEGCLKEGR